MHVTVSIRIILVLLVLICILALNICMSKRCEQVASKLQHQLSEIINRDIESPRDSLITITRVTVSPDLKIAKIFISVLPENKEGTALSHLNRLTSLIRQKLKPQIQFYTLPELRFFIDEYEIKRRKITEALNEDNSQN